MRKYIFIVICGMFGAISRFAIKNIHIWNYNENIPLNTLFINITGSFLLALILTIAFEVWNFDADIRIGITTGFLGAYTTFSTLCKETVKLLVSGEYFSAISYITVSTVLGLVAAYSGIILAREASVKIARGNRKEYIAEIIEEGDVE